MANHNTHRAAGRAITPINSSLALKGAGGAAVLGSVMVGSFAAAQAAPSNHVAAAPQAAVAAPQAPAQVAIPAVAAPQSAAVPAGQTLVRGVNGGAVEALQSALNDNGANLEVDGVFGPRTHAAVVDFQQDNGLKVDGRVGPETRSALNDDAPATASKGTSRSADSDADDSSADGSTIVRAARAQIGTPYRFAASDPGSGFDCSGLTQYAYSKAGIDLPHSASAQAAGGHRVSQSKAEPGDLVVWPGHVGIYAGGDKVIDAGNSPHAVTERTIWGSPSFVSYR